MPDAARPHLSPLPRRQDRLLIPSLGGKVPELQGQQSFILHVPDAGVVALHLPGGGRGILFLHIPCVVQALTVPSSFSISSQLGNSTNSGIISAHTTSNPGSLRALSTADQLDCSPHDASTLASSGIGTSFATSTASIQTRGGSLWPRWLALLTKQHPRFRLLFLTTRLAQRKPWRGITSPAG